VGKTRLVAAAAALAARAGALVLFGRCDEGLRVPYQPFVELLSAYVTSTPSELLATQLGPTGSPLGRLLPELTAWVPGLTTPTSADPETERWRLFQAAAHLLKAVAATQSVMLVIEDLHWAEPATLLLLRHLARADIDNLVVVATTRSEETAELDALVEAMVDLAREDRLDTIALAGLNEHEVAALVGDRLDCPTDPGFAAALQAQTGGNPFFIHELISHLIELGTLTPGGANWPTLDLIEQSGAPQGVQHVLSRRVRKLSARARDTLSVAAVAGAEFQATDLVGAVEGDVNQTLMMLEEVANSGLIREIAPRPGRYRFAHALIRHTLYERLASSRRAQLHWRVAEAIRATNTLPPERLDELAYHYVQGIDVGDPVVAGYWLQQAGDRALAQLAFEEAIKHYRAALAALDRCPDDVDRRYDLLAGLGESADAISDYDVSHRAWLAAIGIARNTNVPAQFLRALFGHENIMRLIFDGQGFEVRTGLEDKTFEDLVEEGLEIAGPGDSPERARLLAWKGAAVQPATPRSREQRKALVLEALAMARRTGSYAAQQAVLGTLGEVLWGSSQAIELMAVHKEQVRLLATHGSDREGVWPYRGVALAAIALGRRSEAHAALDHAETLARAANCRLELHGVLTIKTAIATAEGRFVDAERVATEIRNLSGASRTMIGCHDVTVCAIRVEQGRADEVIDFFRYLPEDPSPSAVAWLAMVAGLYADVGYLTDAAERFGNLVAKFAAIPRDSNFPLTIRYLAETCAQLGTAEPAAQLLPEVEPYSGLLLVVNRGTSIEAAADRSLGQLYALLDRPKEADAHFNTAYRLETSMGFTALAARTRYWHGRLLAHTEPNVRRERLTEARDIATKLGMTMLQRQATKSLDECASK
jgi:tetratricopeptide (TPR) repeat protein